MGVHDHHESAPRRPLNVWVVTASSTRSVLDDPSGELVASLVGDAGHTVLDRTVVHDDIDAIRTLMRGLAQDGATEVVILTGGTGVSLRDVTPEALAPLFTRVLPGFGELFRMVSFQRIGPAAMMSRATAGMVGPLLVFAIPGSPDACRLALEELILPELPHLLREITKEGVAEVPTPGVQAVESPARPAPARPAARPHVTHSAKAEPEKRAEPEKPQLPAPSGKLGRLGRLSVGVNSSQDATPAPGAEVSGEGADLPTGWLRAVYELGGEVTKGTWPEIPEELEKVAPIIDVLHSSGARGTLKLPNGKEYALFGFPHLEKGAKVLAIAAGSPVAEILALHRYPVLTGTCIDEAGGFAPRRNEPIGAVAEAVVGVAPKDVSGELLAVQGDAVFLQRGTRGIKWDGHRDRDEGTIKQVLATLALDWSRR